MDFPFYDNYDSIFENAWEETARLRREIAYLSIFIYDKAAGREMQGGQGLSGDPF